MRYLTDEDYRIAEENGISRRRAYLRYYGGWSIHRSITEPVGSSRRSKYHDYKEICEKHGVSYQMFIGRIRKGMKPEEAAISKVTKGRHNTLVPAEIYQLARENGINKSTVKTRIRYGWDHTLAATEPPNPKGVRKRFK